MRFSAFMLAVDLSATACDGVMYECRELVLGPTYFVGRANRLTGATTYVRMVSRFSGARTEARGPAYVRVGAQTVHLGDATPTSLSARGVPEITATWAPRRIFGVNCRSDRTEAGLELYFEGDRLAAVTAARIGPDPCDFAIGWDGAEAFSLPATGEQLAAAVSADRSLRECRSDF